MKVTKYKHVSGNDAYAMEELPRGSQVLVIDGQGRREWSDTWSDGAFVAGDVPAFANEDSVVIRIPVPNVEPMDVLVTKHCTYLVVQQRDDLRAIGLGRITNRRLHVCVRTERDKIYAGEEEVIQVRSCQESITDAIDINYLSEKWLKERSTRIGLKREVAVGKFTAVIEDGEFKVSEHGAEGTLEDVERALEAISNPGEIKEGDILELRGEHKWAFVQKAPGTIHCHAEELVAIYCKTNETGGCVGGEGWDLIRDGKLVSRCNSVVNIHRSPETFFWFIGNLNGSPTKYPRVGVSIPDFCGFDVNVTEDGIKVGCQTITKAQLEELAAALKESKNGSE